jgi:S-DNA-T family DNA segregation ATPase FtsK/SpoIIIE
MTGFLARQPDEVWGLVLVLLGIMLVLGVHLDVLGLLGRLVRGWLADGLGWGADVLPGGFVVVGSLVALGRARRRPETVVAYVVLVALATAGLADLAGGLPRPSASFARLGGAGGLLGSEVGAGLHALLGMAGAVIVLGVVVVTLACAALGVPARAVLSPIQGALARRHGDHRARTRPARSRSASSRRDAPRDGPEPQVDAFEALGEANDEREAELAAEADAIAAELAEAEAGLSRVGAEVDDVPEAAQAPREGPDGHSEASDEDGEAGAGSPHQLGLGIVRPPSPWRLPSARLLSRSKSQGLDRRAVEERGRSLERALAAHGVETHLVGFTVGPTVTRFELELGAGVKVARVTSLAKDIAYAMASPDVRILAPIPGRSAIGVEVPNQDRQLVTLGDVLASAEARRASHPLEVALGRDIAGRAVMVNLAEMPHLLIAGATGAGKSSCINSTITSILMRSTPEQVRLILIDPKRVELGQYNGLPHLLTPVVVNPKKAANALAWAVAEMERRYDLLAEVGMRDVNGYNAAVDRGEFETGPFDEEPGEPAAPAQEPPQSAAPPAAPLPPAAPSGRPVRPSEQPRRYDRLPYVLVVVDELNDLMMVAARDVEESICRIAQMARAVGIHLVIATQRPSVDVITGVIKANVPSRLAFSVSSLADSRVILDQPGAERLVGRGDLLLLTASSSVPRRIQGPWVSEEEVRAVVAHWRRQSGPCYLEGIVGEDTAGAGGAAGAADDDDDLLAQAMELVVRSQLGSTSMLQRKLRVGFARAGRLMDLLEQRGVVGPSEGSKARAVLMTPDELDASS